MPHPLGIRDLRKDLQNLSRWYTRLPWRIPDSNWRPSGGPRLNSPRPCHSANHHWKRRRCWNYLGDWYHYAWDSGISDLRYRCGEQRSTRRGRWRSCSSRSLLGVWGDRGDKHCRASNWRGSGACYRSRGGVYCRLGRRGSCRTRRGTYCRIWRRRIRNWGRGGRIRDRGRKERIRSRECWSKHRGCTR